MQNRQPVQIYAPPPFYAGMRQRVANLGTITKIAGQSGQLTPIEVPRVGLAQGIQLIISTTVAGTIGTPNPLGMAGLIESVRVNVNSGQDLYNVSGVGYSHLLDYGIDSQYFQAMGATYNQGKSAVSAATFRLDMWIPLAYNILDPRGLFNLQSETSTVQIFVTVASDATMASGGATVTATVTPYLYYFSIPTPNFEPLPVVHQIVEDQVTIAAAGDYDYQPLRGQIYLQVWHGATIDQTPTDDFNRFRVIVGSNDYWKDFGTPALDTEFHRLTGQNRPAGVILQDYAGSSGLGTFGSDRDFFDTWGVTSYIHRITFTGAATLRTIRRQFVRVD